MSIDKKEVEEFENKSKDMIYNKISEVFSKQYEIIGQMETATRNLGQSQVEIPNACVTLNNKLRELSNEFHKSGISMFAKENEKYGYVGSSFVGYSIINDLIDKLVLSTDKFKEYGKTIDDVTKKKNSQYLALQNMSPIKTFFSKIRAFFTHVKPVDFSLTEEELGTLNGSLKEYTDIDSEIWKYNLEDNLIPALVKEIAGPQKFGDFDIPHRHHASNVPGLLEESVIPDLKKLGLEHLIPKLKEALIEEYKKDLPESEIYQIEDEDMRLYVPDFSKELKESHEVTEEELQDMYKQIEECDKNTKKLLKSINEEKKLGGLDLRNFEAIDLGVSATQRKETMEVIRKDLSKEQLNDREKIDKKLKKDDQIEI